MLAGKLAVLLFLATLLSFAAARLVSWRYRKAMQRLMKIPLDLPSTVSTAPPPALPRSPLLALPGMADNRQARRQLMLAFFALTLVMSISRTLLMQVEANGIINLKTVATLTAIYLWPVIPVLAVIDRWRRRKLVGALLLWFVGAFALSSWRTTDGIAPAQLVSWLSGDIGVPLVVVCLLCLGGATRAVAPWLAPLFVLLCATSQAGLDLLAVLIAENSPLVHGVVSIFSPAMGMLLFALAPWLLAWWPARAIGRWLAAAYTRRQISELVYLFTAVWVIALTNTALGSVASGEGWGALIDFSPLLWIPLGAWLMGRQAARRAPARPPTLLVLRVFRQDANVQSLFDQVIDRWRVTGNTVLIAGTDLADRTIDPDDIFTFLDGRLGERFIRQPGDVAKRLAAFEWLPDIEGRYRVNECYCHDTTWQLALAELLHASDLVLMDLRNFVAANAGCVYELETLSAMPGLHRVVVLINDRTELPAAQAATGRAPAGRFVWLQQTGSRPPSPDQILGALLGPAPTADARS